MMENFPPLKLIEQLKPLLGAQLPDFLHSYEEAPARGIRMRPGRAPLEEALGPVPWAENAYYLPLESVAGAQPLHEAGAYYLQEPSAMAAAAALRPQPGDRVLDLCAAPGGKSTQLAAYMQGRGLLVCNEPVPSRAQILSRNLERMGVTNALAVSALPEALSPLWPDYFDKILVDAPCSGEGMFRRHPETALEWTPAAPAGCAQRQSLILAHAARMLRPGGLLAYSTCTFSLEENEGVIEAFLRQQPWFSLTPFALPGLPESEGMLRLWPHRVRGEGHFVALLRKSPDAPAAGSATKKKPPKAALPFPLPGREETALAAGFLREHGAGEIAVNGMFAGRLIQAPGDVPPLQGVKVLRLGLQLGEIKGRVFAPDHALALAWPVEPRMSVSEEQARDYQAGQVLPAPPGLRGYCAPALDGLPLGWGKASEGQVKNHYPKGLRKPIL